MKVRVRFAKYGSIRYLGHLDMMRFFQKAIRRAQLPIAYSEGFHPHQIMSFASPLGVGITSDGEYMDLTLVEDMDCGEIANRLQEQMTEEVRIVSVHHLKDDCHKAMAILEAASYLVFFRTYEGKQELSASLLSDAIRQYITEAEQVLVEKATKKSTREVDLKPLIYEIDAMDGFDLALADTIVPDWRENEFLLNEKDPYFTMTLCARSSDNVKPKLLLDYLLGKIGIQEDEFSVGIHRIDMLAGETNRVSLEAFETIS